MAAISVFPGKWLRVLFLPPLFLLSLVLLAACTTKEAPPTSLTPAILPPGVDAGMKITVEMSKPANGTHYVSGDKGSVTVTLRDNFGNPLTRDDFATLNLYMYGPQETTRTVTAIKLLNAVTDRSKRPHHYIDLLQDASVVAAGNVLKYGLQPVSNEEPGTYTTSLWAIKKGDPPVNQAFILVDFQLGTATVEKQIVEQDKCASCHLGAQNGQFYFHHVDPGRSPYGNPAIDTFPVRTCKSCHNNDGYAAYALPDGKRVPDPIVFRVHGVHFGEELHNPVNTDLETGLFRHYRGVVFPADVRNCTACHTDDRWKTKPSRLACGACHDAIDWATGKSVVKGVKDHAGGPQASDAACATCHTSDNTNALAIAVTHDPRVNTEHDELTLKMSAPKNGKFYVKGEAPVVTVVIKDSKGNPIDHTKVNNETFAAANLYIYGPRAQSVPVLTAASRLGNSQATASVVNYTPAVGTPKGWAFAAGDTFKIAVNGGPAQVLAAPVGLQSPDQVRDWLRDNLKDVTVTSDNNAGTVTIRSNIRGDGSRIEVYNSRVTTIMGWKRPGLDIIEHGKAVGRTSGVTVEPFVAIATAASTVPTDMRRTTDPALKRTAASIEYQLDVIGDLKPGTYMAYAYANYANVRTKNNWLRDAFGIVTFQVGTETPEPKIATNCEQCHGNTVMHLNERNVHPGMFDTDYCKACHDYNRSGTGEGYARVGGTSTSGWAGYGAKPIVARVHGVHRGAYLEHKEEVYEGNPNMASEIIFTQDIRNCQKCHDPKGSPAWKENASRLACLSCHDSDQTKAHARLMTLFPTPTSDPYGPGVVETCNTCHGAGKEFSPDRVHNISNPYKPPYPREAE